MDRDKQRAILLFLESRFPERSSFDALCASVGADGAERELTYLSGHDLVETDTVDFLDGTRRHRSIRITSSGLDFLEDDGGVSAILSTFTVRLHDDTIRQLLSEKINDSSVPPSQKERLQSAIREAPSQALRQVSTQLVREGIERVPDVVGLLRTTLGL